MLLYEVNKLYEFEAAHQLANSCASVECERMHGHSYKVRIGIETQSLDSEEMVLNFNDLDAIVKPEIDKMDHRVLVPENNTHAQEYAGVRGCEAYTVPGAVMNTTAERLAQFFVILVNKNIGSRVHLRRIWATVNETRKCQARAELIINKT